MLVRAPNQVAREGPREQAGGRGGARQESVRHSVAGMGVKGCVSWARESKSMCGMLHVLGRMCLRLVVRATCARTGHRRSQGLWEGQDEQPRKHAGHAEDDKGQRGVVLLCACAQVTGDRFKLGEREPAASLNLAGVRVTRPCTTGFAYQACAVRA